MKCKSHEYNIVCVCVCLCVQWFCRQASVPVSVSVSDVHHWATAITLWLQDNTLYHGGGMYYKYAYTIWEDVAEQLVGLTRLITFLTLFELCWDRKSSSADSPLIQSTVTLPHVILESVPLYIHAGQYTHSLLSENTHYTHIYKVLIFKWVIYIKLFFNKL